MSRTLKLNLHYLGKLLGMDVYIDTTDKTQPLKWVDRSTKIMQQAFGIKSSPNMLVRRETPQADKQLGTIDQGKYMKLVLPGYKQNRYVDKEAWEKLVADEYDRIFGEAKE